MTNIKRFTKNQKALIADYTINTNGNEVYLYEEQVTLIGHDILENNQISAMFEFNMIQDGGLNLNLNQQRVMADYISSFYEGESTYTVENYEHEYYYLKHNNLLHKIFEVYIPSVDISHFNDWQTLLVGKYMFIRDNETEETNYPNELIGENYNFLKDTNQLHRIFESHNPLVRERLFYSIEFDLIREYKRDYFEEIQCCPISLLVSIYESLSYANKVHELFEFNSN
jgi:hypothetical protein